MKNKNGLKLYVEYPADSGHKNISTSENNL